MIPITWPTVNAIHPFAPTSQTKGYKKMLDGLTKDLCAVTGFAANATAKMHNAVRTKSAALGADAAILTEEGVLNNGWAMEKWATGVAIKFQ